MGAGELLRKPVFILIIIIVVILLIFLLWMGAAYNGLVSKKENAIAECNEVRNQYQRKFDLIPNLVNVTSQYTQFEKGTLENITRLRSQLGNTTDAGIRGNITNAIDNLLISVRATYEAYPELQSIGVVFGLFDELAGTENRITVARGRYIDIAKDYNVKIQQFPDVIVAGWFGFDRITEFCSY